MTPTVIGGAKGMAWAGAASAVAASMVAARTAERMATVTSEGGEKVRLAGKR